jgi:ferritin-like metal-binding protein YciE
MSELQAKDLKLIQYLNEAYGKEKQLETALEAHIAMTTRDSYRKRLRSHLTETKRHAREVESRIRKLGGKAEVASVPGPGAATTAASAVQNAANRAAALAQGPLHALRGTGEQEMLLKNAKTEYQDEAEEIATYTAIEALAETVGDKETAKLARSIRRDEERMAKFLENLIPTLTRAVAQTEIPASERNGGRRRSSSRSKSSSRSRTQSRSSTRSTAKRSSTRSSAKRTATRSRAKAKPKAARSGSRSRS